MKRGSEATSMSPWEPALTSPEPCGSSPVTHFSQSAHYCHHHQAWSCSWSVYREHDEEHMDRLDGALMSFGPFDAPEDVRAWLSQYLLRLEEHLPQ